MSSDVIDNRRKSIETIKVESGFEKGLERRESKWKDAFDQHIKKSISMIEKTDNEIDEMKRKKSIVEAQRMMSLELPRLSRVSLTEEKRKKADEIKLQKAMLEQKKQEEKQKRVEDLQNWNKALKNLYTIRSVLKRQRDLERQREIAATEEARRKLRNALGRERERKKLEEAEWAKQIEKEVKIKTEKKVKKRKAKDPGLTLFASRFQELQMAAKKRKEKEERRKRKEEEKRLKLKQKRKEAELKRREEVDIRLAKTKEKLAALDKKRLEEMDLERNIYLTKKKIYEAEKAQLEIMSKELLKADKIKRKQKLMAQRKQQREQLNKKLMDEIERRNRVDTSLEEKRHQAAVLGAKRAAQLAAEELDWQTERDRIKSYNDWVRNEWARENEILKEKQLEKEIIEEENERLRQVEKMENELKRRTDVLKRIEYYNDYMERHANDPIEELPNEQTRRNVLELEKQMHDLKIEQYKNDVEELCKELKLEADKSYQIYYQDRENELKKKQNMKKKILEPAKKKAWK